MPTNKKYPKIEPLRAIAKAKKAARKPIPTERSDYLLGRRDGAALGWKHGHWHGRCEAIVQAATAPAMRRPIHVLYVTSGKSYPYSPLDEGIHTTLLGLAERVTIASPRDDVAAMARADRPDLVLVLDGMEFPAEQVQQLRLQGVRTAIWFTDDPYYTDVTATIAPLYDHIFTLERNCLPFYQQLGCQRVYNLPLGVHPAYYRPRNPRLALRGDLCFIGTAYWNRVSIFHELLPRIESLNFRLSGLWWDRLPEYGKWKERIELGKWMTPLETAEYYNAHRIVVNVHRAHDDETFNKNGAGITAVSPNPRTFEISACGTLQIVDHRDDLTQFYEPGTEIVTYQSIEELAGKVEYYLAHEEERERIALRALYRTLRDHSYTSRLSQLLDLALVPA
ncbi:spore maturation protein [Cohnella xylanilytica]|uniref:Glycosyltransferase n=1 Tax=Cohnella xylanilytica TaxID=557555 RepID=A0A841U861_9BACL|nr:glycosyltransferase [Cohnella xylanilytica]MBB6694150.1 glycosyltransferase [Cohnella xylanilytica]GIO11046.1 spore maturation protein [Cohnella xylanilytica]